METTKMVSIVIPVYNNEKYVTKCIESVCGQTYRNLQIILVDDGSKDSSGKICDQFAENDSRIVVIHQENGGVSNARNSGIAVATGEYLTFVDGDDYIGADYIKDLVECAEKRGADMIICGMKKVSVDNQVIEEVIPGQYIRFEHEEWCFRICTVACHFYQKEMWDRYSVKFWEGERGEDIPIALFFAGICENIITMQQAEYYYVQHEASATHNFKGLKSINLPYQALEEAIQKVRTVGLKNDIEFHVLFVLRVLSTFVQLAKGASKEELVKLADYIKYILDEYYPSYYKNKKNKIFSKLDIPIFQKIAVRFFVWIYRCGLMSIFLRIAC
ncbi:MAG: glycosyltransferase [Lachnospiraceae bacterium]|nr:glycosyltransferase [Lachnospiraceae bacterium]